MPRDLHVEISDEVANEQTKNRLVQEAEILVAVYQTFITGGFTPEQAFDLIEGMLARNEQADLEEDDDE